LRTSNRDRAIPINFRGDGRGSSEGEVHIHHSLSKAELDHLVRHQVRPKKEGAFIVNIKFYLAISVFIDNEVIRLNLKSKVCKVNAENAY
jgi:hypothetical protein